MVIDLPLYITTTLFPYSRVVVVVGKCSHSGGLGVLRCLFVLCLDILIRGMVFFIDGNNAVERGITMIYVTQEVRSDFLTRHSTFRNSFPGRKPCMD